ncbi:endonuclease/exonuclease/phosphatase family protein [Sulfuriroseicoccus oceanibius]|uniref:Endonuclease/exonuclease/phosphatase family protein n=1 Tax=Sulfuriroseicoccus oceanibius TaxID=2707525 RepID=A0A6B3LC28_9BACT|nr:endonuclease/exonuclease/phosphatase family protein [Sulfuriroseicoccus oceanibius]QQL45948.1 endonuclease/exonuclease/phosphatase family protein [Sulfuriroseicoccus oceanibius]
MKILTRKAVLRWARLLVWGTVAYGVALFFADRWWGLELLSNLRVLASGGALIGALMSLVVFAPMRAISGVLVATWMAWPVLDYYGLGSLEALSGEERGAVNEGVPGFSVVSFNLGPDNAPMDGWVERMVRLPKEDLPDCVFLMEVRPATYREHFNALRRVFPYQVADPRSDNFGVWLMSRWPIAEDRTRSKQMLKLVEDVPLVDVDLKHKQLGEIRVMGVHPVPPMNEQMSGMRADYFRAMMKLAPAEAEEVPLVVAGDFNCAPWSYWFDDLCAGMGVRNAAYGHGLELTWKPYIDVPFLGMPIDHILISDHWHVDAFSVGDAAGSDHRPLRAVLQLREVAD